MPKSELALFDPFAGCYPGLETDINAIGGSALALMTLVSMHGYAPEEFTSYRLQNLMEKQQGKDIGWVPTTPSLTKVFHKLGNDPQGQPGDTSHLLSLTKYNDGPGPYRITAAMSQESQYRGAAYAGPILNVCLQNRELTNEVLLSRTNAVSRFILYSLLSSTEEPVSTLEASYVLGWFRRSQIHDFIKPLVDEGVIEVHRPDRVNRPSLIQFRTPIGIPW